ncbi:MAG TPA: cytochrome c biogenesis protein CcdA [Kofleriaceae bacterium]|jgi:thiol:disulfide interchange protein DsbD
MRRALPLFIVAVIVLVPALAHADNCEFSSFEQRGLFWMFLGSFGFGFLTSLTPCVYPMIPITLAIFGARGGKASKKKAIALAAAYVTGMCLTYAILGVTFATLGKAGDFGTQLASPYVVFPLVALFVALAASMFGAFDLNLPASWQAKLNQVGGKGYGGAFAMGLVGGLIAAPCTGPFLAGLLAYVTTTASVVTGGALLYVYGLGMGVLFFVLAAFAVALPKSGRWMDAVKSVGGIGLLLAAIYYLQPFLPWLKHLARPGVTFLGGAIGLGIVGIAIGAITLSFHGGWNERIRKGTGVALVVAGALGVWLWKLAPKQLLPYEHDEVAAFDHARAQHKGVMVDFSAEWCTPCREMEHTFGDSEVYALITDNFVPLKFDVTAGTDADLAHRAKYGAETLPSVLFIDTDGNVLQRVKKMTEVDEMRELVTRATSHTALASVAPCTR